jgi:hypothetical protein
MTKLGLLGAAAVVLSSALAGPAMAQQVIYNPGYCAQYYPNANCQNLGPGNPYTDGYQRRAIYRNGSTWDSNARWDNGWHDSWNDDRRERRESGFGPADVAAGVVVGAVGTAGAIATAPLRSNSYAYDDTGYRGSAYTDSYAARNGFVCQPGSWVKGEDGRMHICQ